MVVVVVVIVVVVVVVVIVVVVVVVFVVVVVVVAVVVVVGVVVVILFWDIEFSLLFIFSITTLPFISIAICELQYNMQLSEMNTKILLNISEHFDSKFIFCLVFSYLVNISLRGYFP